MGDSGLNLASVWEAIAARQGDAPALFCGTTERSWSQFEQRSARLAAVLADAGVGPGDNVACALYNGTEYLEATFAAFKVRAAPCNVNYRYVEAELRYLVDNSDAKVVLFDAALAERFANVRPELTKVAAWIQVGGPETVPDWAVGYEAAVAGAMPAVPVDRSADDLWILYTGGTTGHPKGVMWPHGHLMEICQRSYDAMGVPVPTDLDQIPATVDAINAAGAAPRQLAASPLMHGTAAVGALVALSSGGSVVMLTGRTLDATELWTAVEARRCTTLSIVGDVFCAPMVEALDKATADGRPFDLTSVKTVTSSGVMWSQPIKDRLLAHAKAGGSPLVCNDSLGSSEGVGFAHQHSAKAGTDTRTATFALGPHAAVFTEDGRRVRAGSEERGLLAVGGPIPLGYYGDPAKTAETFREIEGARWSVPGDWATVAEDGTITLLGRGSVSINTGGEKVYPEEVEEALKLIPGVVDANVVGVPDPKWGSAVTAVVQLTAEAALSDKDLVEALRSELSGYKLPKHVVRVDKLYRSPNGKADYRWATATATEALGSG